jgi:hypothetical protein
MDNQHKKIKGYRDLSQEEVDLMNRIKEKASEVGELVNELAVLRKSSLRNSKDGVPIERTDNLTEESATESSRCLMIAKDNLQAGFMWFVRAVALPESF